MYSLKMKPVYYDENNVDNMFDLNNVLNILLKPYNRNNKMKLLKTPKKIPPTPLPKTHYLLRKKAVFDFGSLMRIEEDSAEFETIVLPIGAEREIKKNIFEKTYEITNNDAGSLIGFNGKNFKCITQENKNLELKLNSKPDIYGMRTFKITGSGYDIENFSC